MSHPYPTAPSPSTDPAATAPGHDPTAPGPALASATAPGIEPAPTATRSDPPAAEPAAEQPSRIARGTHFRAALLWSYVVNFGGYAAVTLITLILAAILGPRQFGVLAMALVWITLAQMLLQHGPTMAVIQQEDITDNHINAAFWVTLAGASLFSLLFMAAAPLWAAVNRLPELTPVCLALTPIVMLQAVAVIPDAVLRRRLQLRGIAVRYIVAQLIAGVAAIWCAVAGLGVWALVVQQVGSHGLYAVMLWSVTPWRPRLRPIGKELRDIRGTSLKTLAGSLGTFTSLRADVLVMSAFFGPVVVGLFRFAIRFPEMVVDLTSRGLQSIALPDLARHSLDRRALADRLRTLVHFGAMLSVPALGILAASAGPFVRVIGPEWAEAAVPLRLLCIASAAILFTSLLGPALQAAQRPGLPAILAWGNAGATVAAILLASTLSAGASTTGRLMAVALAVVLVQLGLAATIGYLTYGVVLRTSAWPTLLRTVPSVISAAAATMVGFLLPPLLPAGLSAFAALLVVGVAAAAVAGGVLLALDRQARIWLGQLLARVRRRRPAPAA